MSTNPQFPADLVIFIKPTINGKLRFLCSVRVMKISRISKPQKWRKFNKKDPKTKSIGSYIKRVNNKWEILL